VLGDAAPRCRLERRAADLSDAGARRALLDRIGTDQATLVLTEGVLPYLSEPDVVELATDLAARPVFHWWAVDIIAPPVLQLADRLPGHRLAAAGASFGFAPTDGPQFFSKLGWQVIDVRSSWLEQRRRYREPTLMRALWHASPARLRDFYQNMAQFVLLQRHP
jgi:O-methyltransferase involved in polyketide biosynthesis